MQIKINKSQIEQTKTQLLVMGYFEDAENADVKKIDKQLNNTVENSVKQKEFIGEFLQTKLLTTNGKMPFDKLLLIGLGKQKEFNIGMLRRAASAMTIAAKNLGVKQFATNLQSLHINIPTREKTIAVAESAILSAYNFSEYKTIDKNKIKTIDSMELIDANNTKEVEDAINYAKITTEATCLVRDMVNQPAAYMTPLKIADIAKALPKQIKTTIHDKKAIEKMGMNALLAVNRGSAYEPRLIVLEYSGSKNKQDKPIALVGKGITFDSGGLDIKPADGMETMKMDMAGAATVIAVFKAAAELQLPINLIGVLPCTENMPGCGAYKPGDIIRSYSGKTIEVINTDAEGRVVLADALAYIEKFKPSKIIDLATLTGACVVALGNLIAGVIGTDKKLIEQLIDSGLQTGEHLWELPLYEEFKEAVKSEVADVRNLGIIGRAGGAITGAAFLASFVEKTQWAHLDIAGPAWSAEDKDHLRKGGTGFGTRLLINFLMR